MAPSYSTTTHLPAPRKENTKEEDTLAELRNNGLWAAVITIISYGYGDVFLASQLPPDPRQNSWIIMRSPVPHLVISLLYIAAVTWWGPRYMSTRKPVSGLRPFMMAYNAFQVVFSAWLFYEGGMAGWFGTYSWICQPCDYSNNPQAIRMMHAAFWYHFSKYIDFVDTVFFVLHKKNEHISLLHMTHHGILPVSTWFGIRYHPGGQNTFFGFLNAFVHVVMYAYYLLAAMGPRVRPFLWWKKYLTTLQMVQFAVVFFHTMQLKLVECDVPTALVHWVACMAVVFSMLFGDFYIKEYRKKGSGKVKVSDTAYTHPAHHFTNGATKRVIHAMDESVVSGTTNSFNNAYVSN